MVQLKGHQGVAENGELQRATFQDVLPRWYQGGIIAQFRQAFIQLG